MSQPTAKPTCLPFPLPEPMRLLPDAQPQRPRIATPEEFQGFVTAYRTLLIAQREAADKHLPAHHGAVALSRYRELQIPDTTFLWMRYHGHIDHLLPDPSAGRGRAGVRPAASLLLRPASSLVLTAAGSAFARDLIGAAALARSGRLRWARQHLLQGELVPSYDNASHVFRWGRNVVKCFHQPSPNQQTILAAAEEQRWPAWFDDPLPRRNGSNPKVRLHGTLQDLNRRQLAALIHFKGDGSGRRVGWEYR